MPIKKHDFIEIEYTGKLKDGPIFDTTDEKTAKDNNIHDPKMVYKPGKVCIGENQIPPGLEEFLEGKEINKEYTVELKPEQAFGKKDAKKIKLIPLSTFKKQEVMPQQGLQVNIDDKLGTILRVSGGRVLVDFNHPLSGKELSYNIKPIRIITDMKEKIEAFMEMSLNLPNMKVEVKDNKAIIAMPLELPEPAQEPIKKKLIELTQIKEVEFKAPEPPKKPEPKASQTPEPEKKSEEKKPEPKKEEPQPETKTTSQD